MLVSYTYVRSFPLVGFQAGSSGLFQTDSALSYVESHAGLATGGSMIDG